MSWAGIFLAKISNLICPYAFSQLCGRYKLSSIPELINNIYEQVSIPSNNDDQFEQCKKEVTEAEVESQSELLKKDFNIQADGLERPSTSPDGEEEFTDDDGTTYKWDKVIRAWVPQVDADLRLLVVICLPLFIYIVCNFFCSWNSLFLWVGRL